MNNHLTCCHNHSWTHLPSLYDGFHLANKMHLNKNSSQFFVNSLCRESTMTQHFLQRPFVYEQQGIMCPVWLFIQGINPLVHKCWAVWCFQCLIIFRFEVQLIKPVLPEYWYCYKTWHSLFSWDSFALFCFFIKNTLDTVLWQKLFWTVLKHPANYTDCNKSSLLSVNSAKTWSQNCSETEILAC